VWIAPLGGGTVGFTTEGTSGKVKRIRNNSAVTLQPCTVRGALLPDAPVVSGTAAVVEGDAYVAVLRAIRQKYSVMARIISVPTSIKKLFGRPDDNVGIVITLTDDASH
jgi:PPOX class probable F420-dependent enzyme